MPKSDLTMRRLRQRAASILVDLEATDLPLVSWIVHSTHIELHHGYAPYRDNPEEFPILEGQARSHQAVRDYAHHFGPGAKVDTWHGAPSTVSVIDDVGVRVWCPPRCRDDDTEAGQP